MKEILRVLTGGLVAVLLAATVCGEESEKQKPAKSESKGDCEVVKVVGDGAVTIHMSSSATSFGGKTVTKTVDGKSGTVRVSVSGFGGAVTPAQDGKPARSRLRSYYGEAAKIKDGVLDLTVKRNSEGGVKLETKTLKLADDVKVLSYRNQIPTRRSLKDVKAGQNLVVTAKEHDGGPVVTRILIRASE
jgi:hypothetical protein